MWYGNPSGRQAAQIAQQHLDRIGQPIVVPKTTDQDMITTTPLATTTTTSTAMVLDVPATEAEIQSHISPSIQGMTESMDDFIRRTCVWCARTRYGHQLSTDHSEEDRMMWEFLIRSPGIWLHALQYSFFASNDDDDDSHTDGSQSKEKTMEYQFFRAPLPSWHLV
jgi:hypothetical protein